ncbi:MAG: MazG-like family protein [Candidatus Portnoybacteria bacterium]
MAFIKKNTTIKEYQDFIKEVYGLNNDRFFNTEGMLTQIQRFTTRALKGIRKGDKGKIRLNLLISLSWYNSLLNQLRIKIEEDIWKRFPYSCSWCSNCPCSCLKIHPKTRKKVRIENSKKPKTLEAFQEMFNKIYPKEKRTLQDAGIHLAEELGEFSEAISLYRGRRLEKDFEKITIEAADLFSCFMGVFNSMGVNYVEELAKTFSKNCHVCKKAPCQCSFPEIMGFKS